MLISFYLIAERVEFFKYLFFLVHYIYPVSDIQNDTTRTVLNIFSRQIKILDARFCGDIYERNDRYCSIVAFSFMTRHRKMFWGLLMLAGIEP